MPTSFNFHAVFFDMDGTLVNSEPQWLLAETELMAGYGVNWEQSDQAYCLGGPLDRVGTYMADKANNLESGPFFTNAIIQLMAQRLSKGVALMPGAQKLLDLCIDQKIPIALVSASPRILVDAVLHQFPRDLFSISISSDEVARVKPFPDGYIDAATHLGVEIGKCLVLEDSLTGVQAAKSSGACVLAIPHLVQINTADRLNVIESLEELTLEVMQSFFQKWNP